ncbi:MAG: GNAT family N-acetyltransferase [Mycobacteriales bacterium]
MPDELALAKVVQVKVTATLALRHEVLRPHQRVEELIFPGDEAADSGHFAAVLPSGRVVSVASVLREPPSWGPGERNSWRLRAMATDPRARGRGLGTQVLAAALTHAAAHGANEVWCHARVPAQSFYQRAGFAPRGAAWQEPLIGPHIAMTCPLDRC